MKRISKSKTTKTVAKAGAGGLAFIAGVLALVRSVAPEWVPWEPSADVAVQTAVGAVVVPLLSRAMARRRKRKEARERERVLKSASGYGVIVLFGLGIAASGALVGCQTTQYPDGTVVRQLDVEAAQFALESALEARERLQALDDVEDAEERRRRRERVEEIDRAIGELLLRFPGLELPAVSLLPDWGSGSMGNFQ